MRLIIVFIIFLTSCTKQDEITNTAYIAVFKACHENAQERISTLPNGMDVTISFNELSEKPHYQQEISAFISLSSATKDAEFLTRIGNGFVTECFVDSSITFTESDSSELIQFVRKKIKSGNKNIYLSPVENGITLHFNQ